MSPVKIILLVLLVSFIAITAYSVHLALAKMKQLERSEKLYKGMSENEALSIMGAGYTSTEVEDETIYIWKGHVSQNYSGIKEVKVFVQDGKVNKILKTKQ